MNSAKFSGKKGHPPDCFCETCDRDIHHLGIMSHRAMHRRRGEDCVIVFSDGRKVRYNFSAWKGLTP